MSLSNGLGVQHITYNASTPGDGKAILLCTLPGETFSEASTVELSSGVLYSFSFPFQSIYNVCGIYLFS